MSVNYVEINPQNWNQRRIMADIKFQINDIHCEKCIEKIRQALENVGGLEEVHFDLDEKIVRIEGEADPIAIEQIIQDTGYTAVQLQGGDKH